MISKYAEIPAAEIGPADKADGMDTSLPPLSPQYKIEMAREAFHGLAGEIVDFLDPYTEADPVATLINTLVAFGNIVGDGPHVPVGADKHPPRINATLVGTSSKSRKGTSWSGPKTLLGMADPEWTSRVKTGLSSGEGLIKAVEDGDGDTRLMVVESEFASMLSRMARQNNSLSGVIRQAWDTGDLSVLTKNNPLDVTGANISIIGHTTTEELTQNLKKTEVWNGFANRFLWLSVKRSKYLPNPESLPQEQIEKFGQKLKESVDHAQSIGRLERDTEADLLWCHVYPHLSAEVPGFVGSILSRAEAQVLRLSLIYALLDKSCCIQTQHLLAALAVWDYCIASVQNIFGDRLLNSDAQRIYEELKNRATGLSEEEIGRLFGGHRTRQKKDALKQLQSFGMAEPVIQKTGGRNKTIWIGRKTGKGLAGVELTSCLELAKAKLDRGERLNTGDNSGNPSLLMSGAVEDLPRQPLDTAYPCQDKTEAPSAKQPEAESIIADEDILKAGKIIIPNSAVSVVLQ